MFPLNSSRLELELQRHAVLLAMVDVLSRHHEPADLFRGLTPNLRAVVPFDAVNFALYDPIRNQMSLYLSDTDDWPVDPLQVSVDDSVAGWVWKYKESVTIDDVARETRFSSGLAWLREHYQISYCVFPLRTPNSNLGALGFASKQPNAFGSRQVQYLQSVADIVALCMDKKLVSATLDEERERVRLLLANVSQLQVSDLPPLAAELEIPEGQDKLAETERYRFDHPIAYAFRDVLNDPEQLISAYFGSSSVGLGILDRNLRFLAVNRALAEMNGVPAQDHLGKSTHEILGEAAERMNPEFQRVFTSGQPVLNLEVSARLPARDEINHWVEHIFPIKGEEGKIERVAAVVVATTKEKKLEESLNALTANLKREKDRLQVLLELSRVLAGNWDVPQIFPKISAVLRRVLRHECAAFGLYDEKNQVFVRQALDFPLGKGLFAAAMPITSGGPQAQAVAERRALTFSEKEIANFSVEPSMAGVADSYLGEGLKSLCCVPLLRPSGAVGALSLASTRTNAFKEEDLILLNQVGAQLAIAMENAHASRQIEELKNRLSEEKRNLDGKIHHELNFEEIVGDSPALKKVLAQVTTVARSSATVLVLGETGTGKELIARAIHRLSPRRDKSFIKVNCAAIPTGLLESELFGHEKGAFTGAISQKIGRMELADKGTLFLDEVGEISLELQPKLLRVLQDQEFERLGSTRTIKINVRLIAATNRDLEKSVAAQEFRSDLFYRLNVFPVRMPPLRERRQDIPMLVRYFVQKYARVLDRAIETIPAETMSVLSVWHWPGNVRELENFIERSVILTEGTALAAPLCELSVQDERSPFDYTLESAEREHILRALRETGGLISGSQGAAHRLGLKRTTLQSKMQRLKITRRDYCDD